MRMHMVFFRKIADGTWQQGNWCTKGWKSLVARAW